ncbi:DUF1559 family PulG-like putative transporter [Allorhodopirellula solitaria]|uniref:DUF1559 domain-containing protein n=1 Tax=Allorhodopirellula solitaria TaxID=2527987 RepID=A0A5C5YJS9_9BACT|nr:DUF1559 domain-containing protein [Allorhodopirellula solitaria]TWT75140.1 hypothetical protein CA85_04290 [Allorhodopirellula solitaria]
MKNKRPGFTLVELLVVIAIIGILMGLLIPAVNAAREAARRNQCATQLKNLALAAIQHENTKGELPGYLQSYGVFPGGVDPSDPAGTIDEHVKLGTWTVALMPWLDAQPTYEAWTEDRYPILDTSAEFNTNSSPNLAIMQCPSNPNDESDKARNSYISNNGMEPYAGSGTTQGFLVNFEDSMSRANGVFNNKYAGNSASGAAIGPKMRLDDMKDGQGNTMLFSENVQALPWNALGLQAAAVLSGTNEATPAGYPPAARYVQGMVWHYEDDQFNDTNLTSFWSHGAPVAVEAKHKINGRGPLASEAIFVETMGSPVGSTTVADLARPSSAHVDGVNAGMADGGTRYITTSIDYRVYQALLTPRGKSSDVPWQEYVIDEDAI